MLANPGRALRGIDEQVAQVADWGTAQRVFVDDVVGDTDDDLGSLFGDDRMDSRRVVHDALPSVAGERLRGGALVEEAVAVEQLAPALLVSRCGPANNHLGRKSFRHKCLTSFVFWYVNSDILLPVLACLVFRTVGSLNTFPSFASPITLLRNSAGE